MLTVYNCCLQVRVIDCFVTEGIKVFYRVVLAVLIIYAKYHGKYLDVSRPRKVSNLLIQALFIDICLYRIHTVLIQTNTVTRHYSQ